ncbi:MAG: hypothetical protein R3254_06330, partial [Thiomicrorhabdus sp.]|nr:hypothetical protein [Thiomicrorhabdus sp.]
MPTVINYNSYSQNAIHVLNKSHSQVSLAMEKLTSGQNINRAADNAAGMAVLSKMSSQVNGNSQAIKNVNDGISLAQTIDQGLQVVFDGYQRMRELTVQAMSGTYNDDDRQQMDLEFQAIYAEIGHIASTTKFNGIPLFSQDAQVPIQSSWETGANSKINIPTIDLMNLNSVVTPPTTYDSLKFDAPQGFDGILVLGDIYQLNLMGMESLTVSYGAVPLLDILGLAVTAPTGSSANQLTANFINGNANLQAAGYSASYNSGDGSLLVESTNQDLTAGDIGTNVIADVGTGLSFSKTVIAAPPVTPPVTDFLDITTMSNAQLSAQTIDNHLNTLTEYTANIG